MPIVISNPTSEANSYGNPLVGPGEHLTDVVKVDLSGLTTDEVDTFGYLKPGVPFTKAGILVASGVVYGIVPEAIKLPLTTVPPTNGTLATETADCFVALALNGLVNRDIVEDNLGRALTAAEIAGMADDGALKLTRT
jgi:hypothetical protein